MSRALEVIGEEVRKLVPPTLFFLALFHMLALTQAVARGATGIGLLRAVAATIGALTVAKAILVVNALPLGRRFDGASLATSIGWKTLLFGLLTVALHCLEEVLPKIRELGGFAAASRHVWGETPGPHILVVQLWLWTGVLLYTMVAEVVRRYGRERVMRAMFDAPAS